jgi:hypothetical protein
MAFKNIPALRGETVTSAKSWHGYIDDVIILEASMQRPPDFENVVAEYRHEKDGNLVESWGPYVVGVNPYMDRG